MGRKKQAVELHDKGYNCAQSVACTFAKEAGFSEKFIFQGAEAFGRGMGSMGTCGAVSAMALVVGLSSSDGNLENPQSKHLCYERMEALNQAFLAKNGSFICKDLRVADEGEDEGGALRCCQKYIEDAVELLDAYFEQNR